MKTIMKSQPHGNSSLDVEVTNISQHGLWLLVGDEELFLSYEDFPWFKKATIDKIFHVEQPTQNHFYWPKMDVDLHMDSIKHPDRYPLIAQMPEE